MISVLEQVWQIEIKFVGLTNQFYRRFPCTTGYRLLNIVGCYRAFREFRIFSLESRQDRDRQWSQLLSRCTIRPKSLIKTSQNSCSLLLGIEQRALILIHQRQNCGIVAKIRFHLLPLLNSFRFFIHWNMFPINLRPYHRPIRRGLIPLLA